MQGHSQIKRARRNGPKRHHCRNAQCSRLASETRGAVTGALEVHRALCAPEWQRVGTYEIASRVIPAWHVSGDFIYCVKQNDVTFVVLCDLMGKGLSAAMWTTHFVDLVHRSAERSNNVSDLLEHFNVEVLNSRVRAPLTTAVAFAIDLGKGTVSCSSAGNPPAIIVRADASVETITAGGPLLGVFSGARYERQDVHLETGEAIIAFSDGLVEATSDIHDELTIDGIKAAAAKEVTSTPAAKISRLLAASGGTGREYAPDDISIVVLQRS